MSNTQQPEALNLEEFRAKVTRAAREPLLARIAELEDAADIAIERITELEGQLEAIGAGGVEPLRKSASQQEAHHADGVPAQTETLLAELAEETEAAENWRRLALQFDNHRLQALGHIKAVVNPGAVFDAYKAAKAFLNAPPLDGEEVLAQRIAELAAVHKAQEDAPVGFAWSGWACMYPGKLPRLYGALEIASVNLDAANGDQLIHLSTSPDPKAQAAASTAGHGLEQFIEQMQDVHFQKCRVGSKEGAIRWDIEFGHYGDEVRGKTLREAITKAIAAQAKKGGAS